MTDTVDDAIYFLGLGRLPGVGPRTVVRLVASFPSADALLAADSADLEGAVGVKVARRFIASHGRLSETMAQARQVLERHAARGFDVVPLTSAMYPPLLRLTDDPPAVLYVRGRAEMLATPDMVAIVGTREPTSAGYEIARRIAGRVAASGYAVVSGLAMGIDTAAHLGSLASGAVAVLGTPIDQVYPAANKQLAADIAERGVLVSEYGLGERPGREAFVQRDRIQAGMSVAVIAVQTGVKGGTLHTVGFAERAGRLVFSPRPLPAESNHPASGGINELIASGRTAVFDGDYKDLFERLVSFREGLIRQGTRAGRASASDGDAASSTSALGLFDEPIPADPSGLHADRSSADQDPENPLPRRHGPVFTHDLMRALDETLTGLAPSLDERGFEDVMREWRQHRLRNRAQ